MIEQPSRWEFSQDKSKRWLWRKFAGESVVEISGESYSSYEGCLASASRRGYVTPPAKAARSKKRF